MFLDLARFGAASMTDVFSGEKAEYNCGIEIDCARRFHTEFLYLKGKKPNVQKYKAYGNN